MICNYLNYSHFEIFLIYGRVVFLFLLSFRICVVSQGGSDGLQFMVSFGMSFLAYSIMQVFAFSASVSMFLCFNTCQSVPGISS